MREATSSADYDAAKKLLRKRLREIDAGEYQDRSGRAVRVADLYESLALHNQANGRGRDAAGRWRHLRPVFGAAVAAKVTTDDVRRYVLQRQAEGAANATVNRELANLRRMFNLGRQSTPPRVLRAPYVPMLTEDNVRTGFVEDADFARLAAEASELWLRTFLELGFTFGWRLGERLRLRVRQVNLALGTIRLDPGTTKNKEGREVAITAKVRELLREATRGKRPDDHVLTQQDGKPVSDLRDAWQSLCCRAGLGEWVCRRCGGAVTAGKCKCGGRGKYRGLIPHDLRRSAAKALRAAGVPESVIMGVGGWRTRAMFERYAIVSSADQRDAVAKLEHARSLLAPGTAPVAEITPELESPESVRKVH